MLRLSAKSVPPAVEIAEDPRADPRPGRAPLANARAPGLWLTRRAADPDGHVLPGPDLRWPHPRPPSDPRHHSGGPPPRARCRDLAPARPGSGRSEEHTSELQSQSNLVCRLLLEKKKTNPTHLTHGTSPTRL